MQVSWIDEHEVAALARLLSNAPCAVPTALPPTPRPQTVPTAMSEDCGTPATILPRAMEDSGEDQAGFTPKAAVPPRPPSFFRERLRALRERAISAGLLTPTRVAALVDETPQEVIELAVVEDALAALAPPPLAETFPPVAQPPAAVDDPGFQATQGTIADRLDAFAAWAVEKLGGGEILVVDEYGCLLRGPQEQSGLVLSTLMAWNAAIRASAQAASAYPQPQPQQQQLPTGETLTLIPCQTRLGMIQVAVTRPLSLTEAETTLLRQALAAAMWQ